MGKQRPTTTRSSSLNKTTFKRPPKSAVDRRQRYKGKFNKMVPNERPHLDDLEQPIPRKAQRIKEAMDDLKSGGSNRDLAGGKEGKTTGKLRQRDDLFKYDDGEGLLRDIMGKNAGSREKNGRTSRRYWARKKEKRRQRAAEEEGVGEAIESKLVDRVEFGETVQRPPSIKARPRKSAKLAEADQIPITRPNLSSYSSAVNSELRKQSKLSLKRSREISRGRKDVDLLLSVFD